MISGKVDVQVTETGEGDLKKIIKALQELAEYEALVGVPAENAEREKEDTKDSSGKEPINNAQLAYIHTNGVRSAGMKAETDKAVEEGTPYPMALQAYIREHGSPAYRVPPRPFLEPAIEKNMHIIQAGMKVALKTTLAGGDGVKKMDDLAGNISDKVKDYFQEDNGWPPLSPKTIARRKKGKNGEPSSLPLVDTSSLRNSIHGIVRKRGEKEE